MSCAPAFEEFAAQAKEIGGELLHIVEAVTSIREARSILKTANEISARLENVGDRVQFGLGLAIRNSEPVAQ
jgi:hypothetical protein